MAYMDTRRRSTLNTFNILKTSFGSRASPGPGIHSNGMSGLAALQFFRSGIHFNIQAECLVW